MSDDKLQINHYPDPNNPVNEVTILKGFAPEPLNQKDTEFSGRIDAPGNFYQARKKTFEVTDCVVVADYEKRSLSLEVFPDYDSKRILIKGKLELDHRLERFGINNPDKRYNREELAQLFKFNRNAFNVVEEGMGFVKKLKDFKLKFDQAFENKEDQRGGKKLVIDRVIKECSLPETIALHLPVFKGEKKQIIIVDVLFDVAGSGDVVFVLESAELAEIIDSESVSLIDKEVDRFPDIAIIYK